MKIRMLHPELVLPTRTSPQAAGYDLYMPEAGRVEPGKPVVVKLGFATELSPFTYALLVPRSSAGFKYGLELNNTMGVIDSDYRGEWMASLNIKPGFPALEWKAGDRLLQFILMPVVTDTIILVDELGHTQRGTGGIGSTGV